ncbi:TrkA C-terminal domain-containing protein [Clostridium botulinum]|uniref:Potassium transporter TrkA n=1 Tax=Clostridium botulinum TaxID=1491 RepID=A0A9Q1ZBM9_CLOBO|nr:TrkA C-terminal domain-containing protein [Clostridium botulinum]KEH98764.1 potassium transporter TrkA [Clostridium botulinum D str. 16868]KEI03127.1 potassium transporter TrkA [Clostridium botulinum C/D str. Sp77]KOA73794.1 potassium transporter TrkA [Clostridium botulinum]KOA79194.1 potassium transporter TrkA [Clostridium botulinum]KOA81454.1 potassium transporter TrkA [Clostridium botulinum]
MVRRAKTPNYIKIAVDIASRIVRNEFLEGSKITGRSTLVSIYKVSPETIRRSTALLKDLNVVTVNDKSGIIINSREAAKIFLDKFKTQSDFSSINNETYELLKQKKMIDEKIENNIKSIVEFATQLKNVENIIHFESTVEKGSIAVGKSIGELNFWHNTKATIIGVKRINEIFVSPGPYFTIQENDILVYVGQDEVLENINNYIKNSHNK